MAVYATPNNALGKKLITDWLCSDASRRSGRDQVSRRLALYVDLAIAP